jgi:hypothetical protein
VLRDGQTEQCIHEYFSSIGVIFSVTTFYILKFVCSQHSFLRDFLTAQRQRWALSFKMSTKFHYNIVHIRRPGNVTRFRPETHTIFLVDTQTNFSFVVTIGIKFVPYGFFLFLLCVCCSTTYLFLAFTVNLLGLLSGSFGFLWAHFGALCHLFGFLRGWLFRSFGCLYLMFTAVLI